MPSGSAKPEGLEKYMRWNPSSGRITLLIAVQEDGRERRLSQRAIKPNEPKSYGTPDEAREGYKRCLEVVNSKVDRRTSVIGFWEKWSDEDHPRFGMEATGRGRDTFIVYRARTRAFVDRYADRQIATMVEQDVRDWLDNGGTRTGLPSIVTFFNDAAAEGLFRGINPASAENRKFVQATNNRRKAKRKKRTPPQRPAIDAMLARASEPAYPRSFYGWLLTGSETGMRSAEIDGMVYEFLDGDTYWIGHQLHYRSNTLEDPKHDSFRRVHLPPSVMHEIDRARLTNTTDSPYIWLNSFNEPWREDARSRWWHWCIDGGAALRTLVGGATMYEATRHSWAWHALNVLEIPVPKIAKLYGHSDGGKTLLDHYADVDNTAAIDAVRAARDAQPADLAARRRRRSA